MQEILLIEDDKENNALISNKLRNKIKRFTDKSYIETIWGVGYGVCKCI